jgi:Transposase DDE domain/Domain of unknown function (DUF4372)
MMVHRPTVLNQLLDFIPRHEFQRAVSKVNGDKRVRTLSCWTQFVALLFGQLTGHSSVRSLVAAINTQQRSFYHLGICSVKRSTLCDANEHRDPDILKDVYYQLLNRTQQEAPGHRFKFKGKVLAFDSTTISLCLSICSWAQFHHGKGAFKLHTAIDLAGDLPSLVVFTPGKVHDLPVARSQSYERGTTIIMDKAYIDYEWFARLDEQGVYFVTRAKENMAYKVRKCMPKLKSKGVCADQLIRLSSTAGKAYPKLLRRISYRNPEDGKHYVFITNRMDLAAKTVCDLYKSRWQVELFFKTLKGQLQVDKFAGTSENAVKWQIWTALIAYLLTMLIKFRNRIKWMTPCILGAISVTLFQKTIIADIFRKIARASPKNIGWKQMPLFSI